MMLIVSSPSGAGKTTLCKNLLEKRRDDLRISISATTRKPREGEVNGRDYFFLSREEFETKRANDEFLENAEIFGNLYGTLRASVREILESGRNALFDVDWQGARQLADRADAPLIRAFIMPPSAEALRNRLTARGQNEKRDLQLRMSKASTEISRYNEYDEVIINDDPEIAADALEAMLLRGEGKQNPKIDLPNFVKKLKKDCDLVASELLKEISE